MDNIIQTVYDYLAEQTDEISKQVKRRDEIESEIESGYYGPKGIDEVRPELEKLNAGIRGACDAALDHARGLVSEYRADVERLNDLNPDDLNDDIKLLNAGVTLLPRDVDALLRRNASNRTMVQIILRYAKEHGIETKAMYYGTRNEADNADFVDGVLHYYEKWIDKGNARKILDKFFGVGV